MSIAAFFSGRADGQIALDGFFIAQKQCPAYQSFRQETNPGNVKTVVDRAYPLHGKNNHAPTHYLIEVREASPERRWVSVSCGLHVVPADGSLVGPPTDDDTEEVAESLLAVSWQPAFCETKPAKPECTSMTADRFDATNLALHGLWPQPRGNVYCGVPQTQINLDNAGDWNQLPALDLTTETREALERIMPGTQSHLERHEWVKHGSCHEDGSAEGYYKDSIALIDALNASALQDFFESHIGDEVTTDSIRAVFDAAFGAGSGLRVAFQCANDGGRRLITEMQVHLRGQIDDTADIGDLMIAASPVDRGCNRGVIDPAAQQ